MGYLVSSVTNLKAIPATDFALRWVNERNAWYRADPTSTGTPDDNRIIQPNTGTGRWVKQLSQVPNLSYTVQEVTVATSVSATAQVMYIIDALSVGSDCTVTLPASPAIGDSISIIKRNAFNFSQYRVVINPNGNNIEGVGSSSYLLDQNSHLELIWVGGTFGWLQTRRAKLYSLAGSFSFSPPSGLLNTTTFNGIFEFAGKGYETGGTWADPVTGKLIITNGQGGGISTASTGIPRWFDRSVASSYSQNTTAIPYYLIISFENVTKYATVQISDILTVFNTSSFLWEGITVLGSNDNLATGLNYGNTSSHNNRQDFMVDYKWDILYKHNELLNGTTISTRTDTYPGVAINVASSGFYRHIMLLSHATSSSSSSASRFEFRELEFWGNVQVFNK